MLLAFSFCNELEIFEHQKNKARLSVIPNKSFRQEFFEILFPREDLKYMFAHALYDTT